MLKPLASSPVYLPPLARPTPARESSTLAESDPPAGFALVEHGDGSIKPNGSSYVKRRLESNHVNLVAIRHGQSEANAQSEALGEPLLYGQSESPLTDKGREQARQCARELYRELGGEGWLRSCLQDPGKFPVFVASSVERTTETAQIMVDFLRDEVVKLGGDPAPLQVLRDDRLKETNFGRFEKRPLSELRQACPEFVQNWRPPQGLGTDFLHRFPGGESRADVMSRLTRFLDGVAHCYHDRTVVVVSHGESVLATRAVLGLAPVQEGKLRAETASVANATPYWLVGQAPRGVISQFPTPCPAYDL